MRPMSADSGQNQEKAIPKEMGPICPLCGKTMREQYSSPKYLCTCGHGEGFIYHNETGRSLTVK